MIANTQKNNTGDLAEKVITGVTKALRQLAEKAAANNENLIVGDKEGFRSIPAKELLKTLPPK